MINLEEYIKLHLLQEYSLDKLDEVLENHLNITYAFNHEYGAEYFTFESLGIFKGCKEIIDYVLEAIDLEKQKKYSIKWSDIFNDNSIEKYFDVLYLSFSKNFIDGVNGDYTIGYDRDDLEQEYEDARWNKESKIFNFIEITIYNYDNDENELAEILTHELMHSYDDYKIHLKSNSSLNKKLSDKSKIEREIKKLYDNIEKSDKTHYNFIDFINNKVLYYLNEYETNSYISQINGLIRNKKFESIKEFIDFLNHNSVTYVNYKVIYDTFLYTDEKFLLDLGIKESTLKKIQKKSSEVWKKIINHTYHIFNSIGEEFHSRCSSKALLEKQQISLWKR